MNKSVIMFFMVVFNVIGSFIPTLWGEDWFGLTSIFLGLVLGFFGIWVGIKVAQRFEF